MDAVSKDSRALVERPRQSRIVSTKPVSTEQTYDEAAKRLMSVINRLEQWFRGERLYDSVSVSVESSHTCYRWNYQAGKFQFTMGDGWKKVINAREPAIMAEFVSIVRELHAKAKQKKVSMTDILREASSLGEEYLQELGKDADLSGPVSKW